MKQFQSMVWVAASCVVLCACSPQSDPVADKPKEVKPSPEVTRLATKSAGVNAEKDLCLSQLAQRLSEYDRMFKAGKYSQAASLLRHCSDGNSLAREKVSLAEIANYTAISKNNSLPALQRVTAINTLIWLLPEKAETLNIELKKMEAQAEKDARLHQAQKVAEDLKQRKSEGIYLGMTRTEVIQSSWGKPLHVNRTTNASGTNEQWVYGGRNYLYFQDGILTTIQN